MEGHQHSSTGVTLQRTQSLFLNVNKSTILLVFIQKKMADKCPVAPFRIGCESVW